MTPFSSALRRLRLEHGKRLKSVAAELGIHLTQLSAIECGRRPPPRDDTFYERLAEYFELSEAECSRLKTYAKQAPIFAELADRATPQQAEFMAWMMEQAAGLRTWEMNAIRAILDSGRHIQDEPRRMPIA